jgi:pimeloyl-ACP methyl ester carboxylesterase
MTTAQVELSAGTVEYTDTGGDGPVIVLLHGLLMDGTLWQETAAKLATAGNRCVVPTLPLGAHRHPVRPGTDLSLPGLARLTAEFLDRLDLRDVTLAGNDTGGAIAQLLAVASPARIGRLVLVSCEAFGNFPPGLTGKTVVAAGHLPPALFGLFMQQMRLRPMRRLPVAFGWLTKRGDAVTAAWLRPVLTQPAIRRDAVRVLREGFADRTLMEQAAAGLAGFGGPALVVWASEDRVMPPGHGRRLAALLPQGQLTEIADSYTLIPLDQPARLAEAIGAFVTAPVSGG